MDNGSWEDELARRLRRAGCPPGEVARLRRELGDHRADLKAEGLERGLGEAEAEAQAGKRLGSPALLAREFVRARRQMDWWSRHPGLLFGVAPLLVFILSFAGASGWVGLVGDWCGWWDKTSGLSLPCWICLTMMVPLFHFTMMILIPLLACRVACHYYYGWTWALASCLLLALHGWLHDVQVTFPLLGERGVVSWGYGFPPRLGTQFLMALLPLLAFALQCLRTFWLTPPAGGTGHQPNHSCQTEPCGPRAKNAP